MSSELKPCPFCGGASFMVQEGTHAECLTPGCCVGPLFSLDGWNTRANQWQSIDSAPRNGVTILVYGKAYRVPGKPSQPYPARWSQGWWMEGTNVVIDYVSHWQPLPEAPEGGP